mmetsp:Transcript_136771/g.272793  ORF Transcript_136771/g.272793 Transcript_136771/m.272793 type:complete len:316 (-) Transcript_136771:466-1413(-)
MMSSFPKSSAHSWRQITSTSAYTLFKMRRVFLVFLLKIASAIDCLMGSQAPLGIIKFISRTRMASKMARHKTCNGSDTASSSSATAGYFSRLIFPSNSQGRLLCTCPFAEIDSSTQNMKSFQQVHHSVTEPREPWKLLVTAGRQTGSEDVATEMVFVMRSGIEAKRLRPSVLSLRNPETIFRLLKSSCHIWSTTSRPDQPSVAMRVRNSPYSASVNTSLTKTSTSASFIGSSGLSTACSKASMSSAYLLSVCVIQYSNGLLLIADMFQVTAVIPPLADRFSRSFFSCVCLLGSDADFNALDLKRSPPTHSTDSEV